MSQDSTEDIHKQIDKAVEGRDLKEVMRLTGLPLEVVTHQRVMTRKERRKWYHDNRRRLKLPKWGQLESLDKK